MSKKGSLNSPYTIIKHFCSVLGSLQTTYKKGTSHDKLYYETQWSKLEERRYDFKLCFMHRVVHKNAPEYLVELLPNTVGAIKVIICGIRMTLTSLIYTRKSLGNHCS